MLRFGWLSALMLCILACHAKQNNEKQRTTKSRLRIGCFDIFQQPNLYDTSGFNGITLRLIYDSLMVVDQQLEFNSQIAKIAMRDLHKHEWEIELKDGVSFADGTPMRAIDVKHSLDCARQPEINRLSSAQLQAIASLDVVNENQLRLRLVAGQTHLPIGLYHVITPAAERCDLMQGSGLLPQGSGPFVLSEWTPRKMILKRNANYWQGVSQIDELQFIAFKDKSEVWAALIKGEIDMIYDPPVETMAMSRRLPMMQLISYPTDFFYMILFDMQRQHLQSVPVRRALNHAIDRQAIVHRVLRGDGQISAGIIRPDNNLNLPWTPYEYSPTKALDYFRQAGFKYDRQRHQLMRGGQQLTLTAIALQGDDESIKTMREVQQYLLDIGIRLQVTNQPIGGLLAQIQQHKADLYFLYSLAYQDPAILAQMWSGDGKAPFYYQNKIMHRFIEEERRSPRDKNDFLNNFTQQLYQSPPGLFLYWKNNHILLHRRVHPVDIVKNELWRNLWRWKIDALVQDQQVNL